jgi:serine protease Do
VEFDGKKMEAPADLQRAVGFTAPGASTRMKVIREKGERTIEVKVGEAPDDREAAARPGQRGPSSLGMEVRPVTPEIARQLNLRTAEGVVVVRVDDESPAAAAGVQRGDVIREVNRQRVGTIADFEKATRDLKDGDRLTVLLQRGPMSLYVAFTVGRG